MNQKQPLTFERSGPLPPVDTTPPAIILNPIRTSTDKAVFELELVRSLETGGFRTTRHRKEVFDVVAGSYDHPTADEIFVRAKKRMPEISFATVYNCLSVLVQCGLVRQVTLDRSPTRFCPNMREHCHFFCEQCGQVTDIELPSRGTIDQVPLPNGFRVATFDISLRGVCPNCGHAKDSKARKPHSGKRPLTSEAHRQR
jgi:Fe2+ or Zn2+ uptake regulation protein